MHLRTKAEVLHEFRVRGISISAWARSMGFSSPLVYQVIAGTKQGIRGQCHDIAVALGMKEGVRGELRDLPFSSSRPIGEAASAGEQAPSQEAAGRASSPNDEADRVVATRGHTATPPGATQRKEVCSA